MKRFQVAGAMALSLAGMAYGADGNADWRDEWRAARNAMVEKQEGLAYDPTSVLVACDEGMLQTVLVLTGGGVVETWKLLPGVYHIAVPDADKALQVLDLLHGAAGFGYAEPDHFGSLGATPNDSFYSLLWGLNNTGQTVNNDRGTANADIDAPQAWDVVTGSASMVVGMADSGIRRTHQDLAANIWTNPGEVAGNGVDDDGNGRVDDTWGWDFWNNDNNPDDDNGHGTHTAGTVGAVGNNGVGVTGVCWNVKLAGLKIGSASGSVSVTAGISAIDYCVGKGIKLSNHSWSGGAFNASLNTAISNARTAGHILACAAGNGGADGRGDNNDSLPSYPASYTQDNIISVMAINNDNKIPRFSNYGATSVDIAAPGETVASCYNTDDASYVYLAGTSMSTPHVTGVCALVWSQNPTWTYSQVRTKVLSAAKPVAALAGKCVTGGCVNANNAVR